MAVQALFRKFDAAIAARSDDSRKNSKGGEKQHDETAGLSDDVRRQKTQLETLQARFEVMQAHLEAVLVKTKLQQDSMHLATSVMERKLDKMQQRLRKEIDEKVRAVQDAAQENLRLLAERIEERIDSVEWSLRVATTGTVESLVKEEVGRQVELEIETSKQRMSQLKEEITAGEQRMSHLRTEMEQTVEQTKQATEARLETRLKDYERSEAVFKSMSELKRSLREEMAEAEQDLRNEIKEQMAEVAADAVGEVEEQVNALNTAVELLREEQDLSTESDGKRSNTLRRVKEDVEALFATTESWSSADIEDRLEKLEDRVDELEDDKIDPDDGDTSEKGDNESAAKESAEGGEDKAVLDFALIKLYELWDEVEHGNALHWRSFYSLKDIDSKARLTIRSKAMRCRIMRCPELKD